MKISTKVKNNLIDAFVVIGVTCISIYLLPAVAALFVLLSLKLGRTLFFVHHFILCDFLPHITIGLLQGAITARFVRNRHLFLATLPAISLVAFYAIYFSFWGLLSFVWWYKVVIILSWLLLIISAFLSARWVLKHMAKDSH